MLRILLGAALILTPLVGARAQTPAPTTEPTTEGQTTTEQATTGQPAVDSLTQTPKAGPTNAAGMTVPQAIDLAKKAIDRLIAAEDEAPPEDAIEDLDRAYAIIKTHAPDNPWLHYVAAGVFRYKGKKFDAVSELEKFVSTREGKNEWKAYRILGDLVINSDFPRLARSHYDNAAKLKENEPSILFGISRCAAAVGDYDEALDYAKQAVAADNRQTVRYLNQLAAVARVQRDWDTVSRALDDALKRTKERVAKHPGELPPLATLAAEYKLLIDTETAHLKDERDPVALERGYLQLADDTRQRGDVVEQINKHSVVKVLEQAAKRLGDETPVSILEQAVVALDAVDRTDDAAAVCRRILGLDPSNELAKNWLAKHGLQEPKSNDNDKAAETPAESNGNP